MTKKPIITLGVVAFAAMISLQASAIAGPGHVFRTNVDGFKQCKALKNTGASYWTATATGYLVNPTQGIGDFFIRTCFSSEAQCNQWVKRIHHHIPGIDYLRRSGCAPR